MRVPDVPASPTPTTAPERHGQLLARVARDERGVTSVIWAISFSTFLIASAMAIDYGIAVSEQHREQRALDAATLAGSVHMADPEHLTKVPAAVDAFYAANRSNRAGNTLKSTYYDPDKGEIAATAGAAVKTTFLRLKSTGRDSIDVGARSKVAKGSGSIELAMVLDNSGSMGGSSGSVNGTYIEDLKAAASNLTAAMFAGTDGSERVKLALVPFAASVNVGAENRGQRWIDNDGQASIHAENFAENRSRFSLFDEMGVAWKGCVETRPGALDTTDAPAVEGTPESLFVPMFAPDEPDDSNASAAGVSNYGNNYISDFGGSCPKPEQVCTKFNQKRNRCEQFNPAPMDVVTAQARTCKYQGATPAADTGPNAGCTTAPILPLNSTKQDVLDAISAMRANGNTNVGEGVMWGWRVLSPGVPFTEGREAGAGENRKFMIVMTDGENYLASTSNHNKSVYASHGYAAKGRLGATYSQSAYSAKLNDKLITACANAKAGGITIFTVAFRLENSPTTQSLLRSCASSPEQSFTAGDGDALLQSFHNIGRQISQLRIAE